ncbi:MAG: DUF4013 domain-containing protein [Sandaracinaceae bacterium]|nr:DUF4013 domain-containing protein [Sandaracinaceae bacterium]
MEYMRGWRALRADQEWTGKLMIGSLLFFSTAIIPIVGQVALAGWLTLAMRRAVSGQDSPLPHLALDFSYLGKLMSVGFKAFLVRMIWSLPIIAVAMLFGCCMYLGVFASVAGIGAATEGSGDTGAAVGGIGMVVLMLVGFVLYFVAIVLISLPLQMAVLRAELTDDLNAGMRFGEVMAMTKMMLKELIVGQLVLSAISMGIALLGMMACYVGIFPAAVVISVIHAYYLAEIYKAYLAKGGQPLPVGPLDVEGGNLGMSQPVAF